MHFNVQYLSCTRSDPSLWVHIDLEKGRMCPQLNLYWPDLLLHQSIILDPHRTQRNCRGQVDLLHMWKSFSITLWVKGQYWILEPFPLMIFLLHFDVTQIQQTLKSAHKTSEELTGLNFRPLCTQSYQVTLIVLVSFHLWTAMYGFPHVCPELISIYIKPAQAVDYSSRRKRQG